MAKLSPPVSLNFDAGNISQAWKKWKQQFQLFLVATESDAKSERTKSSILLTCIGSRGREIFNTFQFDSNEDRMKIDRIIQNLMLFAARRRI